MNKLAYRLIFSQRRGMPVAVAEHVSSQGKAAQSGSAPGASPSSLMRLVHLAVAVAALLGGVTVVNAQIVTEQSGIKAGDGGFTVKVNGNTDLKGGVIASTDQAVQDAKNNFTTGTLTH